MIYNKTILDKLFTNKEAFFNDLDAVIEIDDKNLLKVGMIDINLLKMLYENIIFSYYEKFYAHRLVHVVRLDNWGICCIYLKIFVLESSNYLILE